MTNEELINRFSDNPYDDSLEAEILSRLNRLEEVEKENTELRKQVENLKCCGNCINYIYDMEEDHHYCNKNIFHGKRHAGICSNNWQSDTMTREERK